MTNTIRIKVGSYTLHNETDVTKHYECAAWHQTIRVAPGTYDVYAFLNWTYDGGGYYRVHSLSAKVSGPVVSASFQSLWGGNPIPGTRDRGKDRVGTIEEGWIDVMTYWHGESAQAPVGFTWDARCLVVKTWDPAPWGDGRDHERDMGRMSRFEWSGAKMRWLTENPYGGQTIEAVLADG